MPLTPQSARNLVQAEAGDVSALNNFTFDPLRHVPATEGEVEIDLAFERDPLTAANLLGIYQCRRGLGDDLITAYKEALLAHLEAFKAS